MTDPESILREQQSERAYVNKVVWRLAPFLALLYVFCLLDRFNVSLAQLQMKTDLQFSSDIYGFGAGIFFVGYFLFEVPGNLILERIGARRWIFYLAIAWGAVSAAMMFVRSPMSFYTLRFLLGVAEAGFFPGVILYLTYWIPATSRAQAIARFLAMTAIIGLFGGPLGALLLKMDGILGLAGWQWLFLLEGLPSIVLGIATLAYLPDKPPDAHWLTEQEKQWIAGRLEVENRNKHVVQHVSLKAVFTEPRVLHLCAIFLIASTAGNAIGMFAPLLLKKVSEGTWSDARIAAVGIIPAVVGAIAITLASAHSDRTGKRRQHVMLGYSTAALGFVAMVFAPSAWVIVAAQAWHALGERIGAGSYWALTTNLLGARAAAGGIAMINSVGNLGGFFGPAIMGQIMKRTNDNFTIGLFTAAGLMLVAATLAALLRGQPVYTHVAGERTEQEHASLAAAGADSDV